MRKRPAARTGSPDPLGRGGMGVRRPKNKRPQLTQPSPGLGTSGEEEDEEVAVEGEEGNAGPEEERTDGREGECGHRRGLAGGPLPPSGHRTLRGIRDRLEPLLPTSTRRGAPPSAPAEVQLSLTLSISLGWWETGLGGAVEEKPSCLEKRVSSASELPCFLGAPAR